MRKNIALILTAVMLLCACTSSNSTNQKAAELTPAPTMAPTAEPTVEPTATPIPEKSGYFEVHTTKKVDAFGTLKREVAEIYALNKAVTTSGSSLAKYNVYFLFDRGSRRGKNTFYVFITDDRFFEDTFVDDSSNDDRLQFWYPTTRLAIDKMQYLLDGQKYVVTTSDDRLRGKDFERIYAALLDGKDVDFSISSSNKNFYVFTIHGAGFADLVSSVP